ncbi:MAG: FAD-dependent oxidoreductase [Proteobacteria bacterium]|nr:FAD-dependent oxidoreductase [Pseudomonadota bacterium]
MKAGIAGAGIMGRLLALSLFNKGWDVTLFDKSQANNCSMTAAGLLTPISELEKSEFIIFQLGTQAICQHWPNILAQLNNNQIYFQQNGTLVLAHPRDRTELSRFIQLIDTKVQYKNIYRPLNQAQINEIEPALLSFQHGYYFPSEARIDNQTLLKALENYFEKRITFIKNSHIYDVKPHKICLKDSTHTFDMVFDCRGLGAMSTFKNLRSVRGEIIWLHAPEIFITRTVRFLHPRYGLYIAPRLNQIYLIGASEIESDDLSPISVRSTLELLTAAYCVHRGFAEARIIKTQAHCRPTLKDNLPKIRYSKGLIAVNGLYRHGFLIAPTLANEIIIWLQDGISNVCYPQLWEKAA